VSGKETTDEKVYEISIRHTRSSLLVLPTSLSAKMPGTPPPPGPVDPARAAESNFGRMMAINGTFHALAIISVGLRTYVRLRLVKGFGIDDAVMIAALVCSPFYQADAKSGV
jgi:hypothetical protein